FPYTSLFRAGPGRTATRSRPGHPGCRRRSASGRSETRRTYELQGARACCWTRTVRRPRAGRSPRCPSRRAIRTGGRAAGRYRPGWTASPRGSSARGAGQESRHVLGDVVEHVSSDGVDCVFVTRPDGVDLGVRTSGDDVGLIRPPSSVSLLGGDDLGRSTGHGLHSDRVVTDDLGGLQVDQGAELDLGPWVAVPADLTVHALGPAVVVVVPLGYLGLRVRVVPVVLDLVPVGRETVTDEHRNGTAVLVVTRYYDEHLGLVARTLSVRDLVQVAGRSNGEPVLAGVPVEIASEFGLRTRSALGATLDAVHRDTRPESPQQGLVEKPRQRVIVDAVLLALDGVRHVVKSRRVRFRQTDRPQRRRVPKGDALVPVSQPVVDVQGVPTRHVFDPV